MEIDQHDGEPAGHVAGQDAGHRVAVAVEPEQTRLEPGVERRLKGHRPIRRRLLYRLDPGDRGNLVQHHPIQHGQAAQAPERARGRQVPGIQGQKPRQDGNQYDQREDHHRSRRRAEQWPGRRPRGRPRPIPRDDTSPIREHRGLTSPSQGLIRIHTPTPRAEPAKDPAWPAWLHSHASPTGRSASQREPYHNPANCGIAVPARIGATGWVANANGSGRMAHFLPALVWRAVLADRDGVRFTRDPSRTSRGRRSHRGGPGSARGCASRRPGHRRPRCIRGTAGRGGAVRDGWSRRRQ